MKWFARSQRRWMGAVGLVGLIPNGVRACATCYGAPDSPLTQGLNMGILSLLLVVLCVLGGAAAFFVHLARRAAALRAQGSRGAALSEATQDVS